MTYPEKSVEEGANLVGAVEGALGDLNDHRRIGEGEGLEISCVLKKSNC